MARKFTQRHYEVVAENIAFHNFDNAQRWIDEFESDSDKFNRQKFLIRITQITEELFVNCGRDD